ncbi:MAG: DUF4127 family protein [Phascolarctobacterium sp.]|nr:DUF4127 family protein [Phascolarctobacterium sp.]
MKYKAFLAVGAMFLAIQAEAAKPSIIYVPMDNRPVCLDYTVQTMQAAGWDVEVPPLELIANAKESAKSDELFAWLESRADESVAIVASSDALLYGGLVGSRTHEIPSDVLKARAERLINLSSEKHGQKVMVFTTIMRSPKASAAPVEPAYYKEWGPKIFRLGELEDKLDAKVIKKKETKELADLRQAIPRDVLNDLYARRSTNIRMTELLLHGVESGDFDYMLIGRDDTAPYSQAHREARNMDILVHELPKERIRFFSGADQLGLLLLSRAATRLKYELPVINVTYAPGTGRNTIPSYEDDTVKVSASEHIFAAGAFPFTRAKNPDLTLAINTPYNGKTLEASNAANTYELDRPTASFVKKIERLVRNGKQVVIADIKYGNGADNALVKALWDKNLAHKLAAYGGWNTAGNSLGFALAQGLLAPSFAPGMKDYFLDQRYLDDWAYQANVRMKTYTELIWPNYWPNSGLSAEQKSAAEDKITNEIQALAGPYMGDAVNEYQFTLPWDRMFEVKVAKRNM